MTREEIEKIVDDERAEQLTAQLCQHWEVATRRLEVLAQEVEKGMDTCIEAEIYAALMRMQKTVMALMELNKIPTTFLFSEYFERITNTVKDTSIRRSVMTLLKSLLGEQSASPSEGRGEGASFFDLILESLAQHIAMSPEQQAAIQEQAPPTEHIIAVCAQHLDPKDLMMVASIIQDLNTEGDAESQEETTNQLKEMRQAMDELSSKMDESLQMMLIWLMLLMLLPSLLVSLMQQSRSDSKAMAQLFNKVLVEVRESVKWWNYWKVQRETLRVVSDSISWQDIMTDESSKEREELGRVPGGLFAKWATSPEAFEAAFLEAQLDDDTLRHFIFHLATLLELAREINPTTKFGSEQLVHDDLQRVGEAVLKAAQKLSDLVDKPWFPHYEAMWLDLIQNETIFANLKVTRKSPHNNLFTARFFCHLVGEMKKSRVFGNHSDNDLAEKLTGKKSEGTFRKNIQEGMGKDMEDVQNEFKTIFQKYKQLAFPKR